MNFLDGALARAHGADTVGIRSEHVDVVPEGQGIWTGTVIHAEDLGSDNFLFVDIGATEPLIVRQPGKVAITDGARVSLSPKPGMLHRFNADGRPMQAPLAAE
jgi:multiple sugar transport system ATP-binding protein